MTRLSAEAKVGLFVVIGIVILAYMSAKVGKFEYGWGRGYEVYAYFDSAEGLAEAVPVEIAGVEVGQVKKIELEAGRAKVTLQIKQDVEIGEDAKAAIRTTGVLGDKYVELILGSPEATPIKPGGRIEQTVSPTNIDTVIKQLNSIGADIKEITGSISGVLGGKEGEASLKIIVDNLRELAQALNETVQKNNENINRTLDNLAAFSKDLREIAATNKDALSKILANSRDASAQLQETIVAFNQVTEKINRGEGTIGKLIHDEETVDNINTALSSINGYLQKEERFRTYVDYRGEYLFDIDDLKSYLSVRIQPKEDKYYLLQLVDDPAGKKTITETTTIVAGVPTTEYKEKIVKDGIKFSAQIAKRYYNLGLRGGIFESTGGVAADYYLFDDRLMFSLEAFDFDPDEKPHLKFKADYTPFQYIYLTAGFDDFISEDGNESYFVGAGLHFWDEDIKTLLYGAPIPR
ncbi:MAG: MCE family protein [Desulfobacterales bacterium]|nr:MCE family protein [Desulfobacterales bacterium]